MKRNTSRSVTNERRHVNKSEDYEVRYAKDKPTRTGYKNKRDFEKGGEMGKFVTGSTPLLKVRLENNLRALQGMNMMITQNDMPKFYNNDASRLMIENEEIVKELKQRGVNVESILSKEHFAEGGELETKIAQFEKSLTSELVPEKYKVTIRAEISKLKAEIEANKKPEIEAKKPIVKKAPIKKEEPKKDEFKFNYLMLGRLQADNDYFLGAGGKSESQLWAGNVKDQIAEMKKLWGELPKDGKPEWLSMSDIEDYESKMKPKEDPKKPMVKKAPIKKVEPKKPMVRKPIVKTNVEVKKESTKSTASKGNWKANLAQLKRRKVYKKDGAIKKEVKIVSGTKSRNIKKDLDIKALPKGKRVSKDGNVYYENRSNRSDISPKDMFEEGGDVKSSGWGLNLNW